MNNCIYDESHTTHGFVVQLIVYLTRAWGSILTWKNRVCSGHLYDDHTVKEASFLSSGW